MTTVNSWWRNRRSFILFVGVFAVAAALTACGKGFKVKDLSKEAVGTGATNIALPTTTQSYNPYLEMAMDASEEIRAMANAPANQGKMQVQAQIGFAITLDSKGASVPQSSVLYLSMTVTGADGKVAQTMVTSNQAFLGLSAPSDVHIDGYWAIPRKNNPNPFYIGLESIVKLKGDGTANLQGNVFASFNGEGKTILTPFDQSICTLVVDPWNWAPQYFEEGSFSGCSAAADTKNPAQTEEDYGLYL